MPEQHPNHHAEANSRSAFDQNGHLGLAAADHHHPKSVNVGYLVPSNSASSTLECSTGSDNWNIKSPYHMHSTHLWKVALSSVACPTHLQTAIYFSISSLFITKPEELVLPAFTLAAYVNLYVYCETNYVMRLNFLYKWLNFVGFHPIFC